MGAVNLAQPRPMGGFVSFIEAYVWYMNNEVKYLYRLAA